MGLMNHPRKPFPQSLSYTLLSRLSRQPTTFTVKGNKVVVNKTIKSLVFAILLICSVFAFAQSPHFKSGATIYIESTDGYETYLAAALMKENVPVVIVTQKEQADYIVTGRVVHNEPSHAAVVINNSASASVDTSDDNHGNQSFSQGMAMGQAAVASRKAAKAALGHSDATISVEDAKSTQIVFAYSAEKDGTHQLTKTAEDFATHLKEFIKKSEKKS
jgi:hypothetical protein